MAMVLGAMMAVMPHALPAQTSEDLRALIYYLDQNDQRSVQSEMRRLRTQFPDWRPPADLNELRASSAAPVASVDVAPIWQRIERGDYPGARALIDQSRQRVPSWSPDAEMLRVLEMNETQQAFDQAVSRRDHAAAIAAARRNPALMRCDRINNAWQLAEMYHAAGQTTNAVTTYRGVLSSCSRIDDVVPTLEKANDVTSLEDLTMLFQTARQAAPANGPRLDELEARLRAGRGAPTTARSAAATAAAPAPAQPRAQATAVAAPAPAPVAVEPATVPSSPIPAGALPLRGDSRITQVRALKEAGNWQGCLAASANPRSVELLYERSWCAYNLDRGGEALAGFTTAARTGNALGGNVNRDANFGMMLSYLSMNMTEEAARLAAVTNLTQQQRIEVEATILDQRAVRSFQRREYVQTVAYLNALEGLTGPLRRDLALLRAWSYLNGGQRELAREQFLRLHSQLATTETRQALRTLGENPPIN
jgi:hypothetical protein